MDYVDRSQRCVIDFTLLDSFEIDVEAEVEKLKKALFLSIVLVLFSVIGYSGYRLWGIHSSNAQEAQMHNALMQYHPLLHSAVSVEDAADNSVGFLSDTVSAPQVINQGVVELQAEFPSVVGWLMIPNTGIDYPFVQGPDNAHYLHLDLNQNQSAAGTIFMDYRNSRDFNDFNTIIYGHHMRSGSMFGTMQHFNNQNFFEANRTGTIFLSDATYEIEFIAFAVIKPNDAVIFDPEIAEDAERTEFLEHVRSTARYYREVEVTENDRIVTLSTCNYEFDNARMVLVGRIVCD